MEDYNVELMENLSNGIWYVNKTDNSMSAKVLVSKIEDLPEAMNKAQLEPYRDNLIVALKRRLLIAQSKEETITVGAILNIIFHVIGKGL